MGPVTQIFNKVNITQRQAVLVVLFFYFISALMLLLLSLLELVSANPFSLAGEAAAAILFGGVWMLYWKRNWELTRYFAALASAFIVGLELPEPLLTQHASMIIILPVVLALILTESLWVILNAGLTLGIILVRAHGNTIYAEPSVLILYAMIVGALVVRRLVTETSLRQIKRAEEQSRQNETRFRSLIENSSDEIYILDANSILMYESPSSNSTLGYRYGEVLGRDWFQLLHPDDRDRIFGVLSDLVRDPDLHPREKFRLLHNNGSWRWVEAVGTNLLAEPSVRGIVINYHDITERMHAEEQIQRQIQRLNGLRLIDIAISSSLDLNVTLDIVLQQAISLLDVGAGAMLFVNSNLQKIECLTSRGFRSGTHPYHHLDLGRGYAGRAVLERKIIHIPNVMEAESELAVALRVAGETFSDYYAAPLVVKGEVKGVLEVYRHSEGEVDAEWLDFLESLAGQAAIAIDNAQLFHSLQQANIELECRVMERTAELNKTNADLEHANRAKDEFLANMSHELRTPLNSILGLSESLLEQRRGALNEHQQRSLETIEASGRHLLELINDILDLSKIEAGKFDFYPQPVSVDEFCRSCLAFIKTQAYKKSITVTYIPDPFISKVFADPRRLKQILVNLLTNAVKFTSENGHVILRVNADKEQDLLQFSVIDDGIGIASQDLQRLFQPFVQVDSSLSRQYEGTGLGLSLVQKLTDLHGGSVSVESRPGKGSTFTINLPCGQAEIEKLESIQLDTRLLLREHAEKMDASPTDTTPCGTILLAEDNVSSILTIGEYLESHGYQVVVAHDGLEALEQAQAADPDLILMDIQMPGMNGMVAMARLHENPRFAATPIIALTALAMPGDRERCLLAGASEYLSKPVNLRILTQTIESLLGVQAVS